MDPRFTVLPPRRRSAVSAAVSAGLHLGAFVGAIGAVQAGVLERPPPPQRSLTFVMMLSRELPPPIVAGAPLDAAPATVAPVHLADEPVQTAAPPVPEPPAPAPETTEAATPMPPSAKPSAIILGDISGATGRAGPVVGAFDRPSAQRANAPRSTAATASTGFGADRPAARPVHHVQAVQAGGFELARASTTPAVVAPPEPIETPVEIIFKPTPEYTDEAIALRIQGDVVLEVEFAASSNIQVLRVVSGLGHGLDEAAVRAAARIRFKPATRAGSPVDVRARVHIVFRLP